CAEINKINAVKKLVMAFFIGGISLQDISKSQKTKTQQLFMLLRFYESPSSLIFLKSRAIKSFSKRVSRFFNEDERYLISSLHVTSRFQFTCIYIVRITQM